MSIFFGAIAGTVMGPSASFLVMVLDAFTINTKGTTIAGAILGYTLIDTDSAPAKELPLLPLV